MDCYGERFETFVLSCRNTMYKYCLVLTENEFDADDVLDEALTRLWIVWEERADYPDQYNRGWLTRAIQNIIQEQRRKKQRTVLCGDEILGLMKADNEIGKYEEDEQYNQYLRDILYRLDEEETKIFKMFFVEKCSYEVMSERTGVKSSTLRSQIFRLRQRLREKVDEIIEKH